MRIKTTIQHRRPLLDDMVYITYCVEVQWGDAGPWEHFVTMSILDIDFKLQMLLLTAGCRALGIEFTVFDDAPLASLAPDIRTLEEKIVESTKEFLNA